MSKKCLLSWLLLCVIYIEGYDMAVINKKADGKNGNDAIIFKESDPEIKAMNKVLLVTTSIPSRVTEAVHNIEKNVQVDISSNFNKTIIKMSEKPLSSNISNTSTVIDSKVDINNKIISSKVTRMPIISKNTILTNSSYTQSGKEKFITKADGNKTEAPKNSAKKIIEKPNGIGMQKEFDSKEVSATNVGKGFGNAENDKDSHFFSFLLICMFIAIIFYLVVHNKKRIIGMIVEGRNVNKRRDGRKARYQKLDCNLEEAMSRNLSEDY